MKGKKLNAAMLKWLAMTTMLVDHIAILLSGYGISQVAYYTMRSVGRIAFPVFAFLLAEGFVHTRSFGKYLGRIIVFAVITEPVFDLFMHGMIITPGANILFNFAMALIALYFWAKTENDKIWKRVSAVFLILVLMAFAWKLGLEYSWKCIFIVMIMYCLRYNIALRNVAVGIVLITDSSWLGIFSLVGLLPITFYNGESGKFPKWFGYIFYPLNLLVLLVIGGVVNV